MCRVRSGHCAQLGERRARQAFHFPRRHHPAAAYRLGIERAHLASKRHLARAHGRGALGFERPVGAVDRRPERGRADRVDDQVGQCLRARIGMPVALPAVQHPGLPRRNRGLVFTALPDHLVIARNRQEHAHAPVPVCTGIDQVLRLAAGFGAHQHAAPGHGIQRADQPGHRGQLAEPVGRAHRALEAGQIRPTVGADQRHHPMPGPAARMVLPGRRIEGIDLLDHRLGIEPVGQANQRVIEFHRAASLGGRMVGSTRIMHQPRSGRQDQTLHSAPALGETAAQACMGRLKKRLPALARENECGRHVPRSIRARGPGHDAVNRLCG